ncbi:MAG: hypothetical protein M1834_005603 [Cirrosporium novae-zelandiae]|nr:MAG: hypothetical protein M1834_005603 [Cirrosporium novae-zelandiae]
MTDDPTALHYSIPSESISLDSHSNGIPSVNGDRSPSGTPGPGKKRRNASTTSRGVASLTPEQLAKKRKNDREAQRNIRERTKQQIASLEKRIDELTSQDPYRELQAVLQQKDAIQQENDEIRRRLSSVLSIIQPILGAQSLADLASGAIPEPTSHIDQTRPYNSYNPFPNDPNLLSGATPCSNQSSIPLDSPSPSSHSASALCRSVPPSHKQPIVDTKSWPTQNPFEQQRSQVLNSHDFGGTGERLGFNFLLSPSSRINKLGDTILQQPSLDLHQSSNIPPFPGPRAQLPSYLEPHNTPVANIPPTCILDSIFLDFVKARQKQARDGLGSSAVVGPAYPSVSSLLNPSTPSASYSHPLSKVLTDILSKFPGISGLPEQVAVLYAMFVLMRWQIFPTRENYERIPHWMTPRASQLFVPHPIWVDYLPWPLLRDRLVSCYRDHPFENFFLPYTTTLSLNWPYEPTDALLVTDIGGNGDGSGDPIINPIFERHLRNLENWSLGPEFRDALPVLGDTVRIVDRRAPSGH